MKTKLFGGLAFLILIATFWGCKEDTYEKLRRKELERLKNYVDANYDELEPKPSGLYFIPIEEGTGDSIKIGDRVQIFYATYVLQDDGGTLVDQTEGYLDGLRYNPYSFVVGGGSAIQGLEEAMLYMKKGGKADLIIPSELAYGQSGDIGIPGFTTLLMEVEVYKVFKTE